MINAYQELTAVAVAVIARRDLANVAERSAIIGDLFRAAEASRHYAPTRPDIAEAVALLHICEGLNTAYLTARDRGADALAERLNEATQLAASLGDTAQLRALEALRLPVDYVAGNVGAKLDSGCASILELMALDTLAA